MSSNSWLNGRLININLGLRKLKDMSNFIKIHGFKGAFTKMRKEAEFKVSGKLIGTDGYGHKYYEDKNQFYSRDRWVEYPNKKWSTKTTDYHEATEIPPEWHWWLSRFSDKTPKDQIFPEPIYREPHRPNPTGTSKAYMPPGYFLNPESNNEYGRHLRVRHESWNPTQLKLNPETGRPFLNQLNQDNGKTQLH